ncbi:response regulator transcription factor [uncultured Hoeflea sp.]|uniref:response regulator transcription factor n=1 Tax=uncultured Hoeflea sp. TaxID=538666 RepID=UPI0030DD330F
MVVKKRVAIIDDHQLFLDGASNLFNSQGDEFQVSTFTDPLTVLSLLDEGLDYEVIVVDLLMGSMNGLAFVGALRSRNIATPVLLLSGLDSPLPAPDLLAAGAHGYISKKADLASFFKAVRAVMDGGTFFDDEHSGVEELQASRLRNCVSEKADSESRATPKLSDRQIEILRHIRQGWSNKDISESLSISENTVKSHIKQIFRELNVSKRTASIQKAQVYGLI